MLVWRTALLLATCLLAEACLDQRRLNAHCQRVGDTSTVAIDMRDGINQWGQ